MTNIGSDYYAYKINNISKNRFTFRTIGNLGSTGTGMLVGSMYGGPAGAAAGMVVGGLFTFGEIVHDGLIKVSEGLSSWSRDFNYNLSHGLFFYGF